MKRHAAGGGFRVAEHHADLLAQLVGEDDRGLGLVDGAGQLAQRLGHQAGLHAHGGIAHIAFDLGAGHQGGHRVDDHDIHRAGAHQGLDDLERLLAGIGLRNEQVLDIDAAFGCISRIERMFHVDIGCRSAQFLGFSHDVLAEGGLAGGFRAIDLGDAAARDAADAQGDIQRERAGRDGFDRHMVGIAQQHDRAFTVTFGDVAQGFVQHDPAGIVRSYWRRGWVA